MSERSATTQESLDFTKQVLEAVGDRLDPDQVFGKDRLVEWVRDHVGIEEAMTDAELEEWADGKDPDEVFGEKRLKDWAEKQGPDGVFSDKTLRKWATDNGYVLES